MKRVRPLTTQAVEVDLSRQNFRRMQKRPILHSELNAPRIEAASTTTLVHAVTNIVPSSITRGRGRAMVEVVALVAVDVAGRVS